MSRQKHYVLGNRKVAIIGAGYVGSSIAYALALRDVAREIVMIDINQEKTDGEAKDIRHGLPSMGTADLYAGDYPDCADCLVDISFTIKQGETVIFLHSGGQPGLNTPHHRKAFEAELMDGVHVL